MPNGAELLPVGAKSQGNASPYGCFQTRKMDADSLLYSSRSIYLHFPKGIAKNANGQTEKISFYQIPDGERPARLANCVIPATDKARKLLTAKLRGTSSAQSGVTTSNAQKAGATTSSGGCDGEPITEYVILVYPTHIEIYLTVVICAEAGGGIWTISEEEGGGEYCGTCNPGDDPMNPPGFGGGGDSVCSIDPMPDYCLTPAQRLEQMVAEDPFVLLDVPCGEIPNWQALAQHTAPASVINRIQNEPLLQGILTESHIQRLQDAGGAVVNMDKFAVTVPGSAIPNGWNPEQYLNHIRTHINNYVDTNISQFDFYPGLSGEADKWENNPLGTVFSIQLTPDLPELFDEDGSVVATEYSSSHWTFSTLWTSNDGYHPVSGNRRFGFTDNGDGTYTFYTRGVDRLSTDWYDWGNFIMGGPAFSTADALWTSLQQLVASDFNGQAVLDSTTYRPDYADVQAVLDGDALPSSLDICQ